MRLRVARRYEHVCFCRIARIFGSALAFDLADRLQTPVFVMLDLDIGMQDWLTERSRGTIRASSIAAR